MTHPGPLLERTAAFVKRCVRAVASKEADPSARASIDKAFAICVAQGQKMGRLKPGSGEPTKLGQKVTRSKAAEKGHAEKLSAYEKLLASSRKG